MVHVDGVFIAVSRTILATWHFHICPNFSTPTQPREGLCHFRQTIAVSEIEHSCPQSPKITPRLHEKPTKPMRNNFINCHQTKIAELFSAKPLQPCSQHNIPYASSAEMNWNNTVKDSLLTLGRTAKASLFSSTHFTTKTVLEQLWR